MCSLKVPSDFPCPASQRVAVSNGYVTYKYLAGGMGSEHFVRIAYGETATLNASPGQTSETIFYAMQTDAINFSEIMFDGVKAMSLGQPSYSCPVNGKVQLNFQCQGAPPYMTCD